MFREDLVNELEKTAKESGRICYEIAVMDDTGTSVAYPSQGSICHNSYSVAKAFTAVAAVMLEEEGKLDLNATVYSILGKYFPKEYDKKWEEVTVHHCIRHTTGIKSGFLDIDCEEVSKFGTNDWLEYCFQRQIVFEPGTEYRYSDGAYYILSRIVREVSGMDLEEYLRRKLFKPCGFTEFAWSKCVNGYSMGATGLYIRSEDCAKLGYILCHEGMYKDGQRILSKESVDKIIDRQYSCSPCCGSPRIRSKSGMLGQMLLYSLDKKVSIAFHCFDYGDKIRDQLLEVCEKMLLDK